ncbi:MAG: helix-turn-helix domain-containing protein [Lentisphaeria bacterium]|nr:helix-turn-helix domain-containing protein [Lentisphaeria bacterium]
MSFDKTLVYSDNIYFAHDPEFPLRVWMEHEQGNNRMHCHEFCECIFITAGQAIHNSNNAPSQPIRQGDILVIPIGGEHNFSSVQNLSVANLLFDPSRLPSLLMELYAKPAYRELFMRDMSYYANRNYPHFHPDEQKFAEMQEYLERLANVNFVKGMHCYKLGLFMVLMSMICDSNNIHETQESRAALDIVKVSAYLERHFARKIYLEELLKLSGMSRATLMRHFHAAFGVTPIAYLQRIRLKNAAHLLINSQYSLQEISIKTGFSSDSYFFRAFRKAYAVTPIEYRRKRIAEKEEQSSGNK